MATASDVAIVDLDRVVEELSPAERAVFQRIFHVGVTYGRLVPPDSMLRWIEEHFGQVESTLNQKIVKVTNVVTMEGVLFNVLRSSRPLWKDHALDLENELARTNHDPLDNPLSQTPEDVFGRVHGRHCVTASNIAKFDGFHGLVVFNEKHPLRFTRETIHDYIETGQQWAHLAHREDPAAKYYFFLWNCLWPAGASLLHGHAQVMLGRDMHYAAVEYLRRAALLYEANYRTNYFDDFYEAHRSIGCGFQRDGVRVMANLAPIKEKEVLLLADEVSESLKDRIHEVLTCYRDVLGVSSFNLVIYQRPIAPTQEHWEGFPVVVRVVERGDPVSRTNDFGAMELYASSVVSSDPMKLAGTLEEALGAA
ncbi:MAG: hypothetical protein WBF66_04230 [Dehalococcoidia bacterium]